MLDSIDKVVLAIADVLYQPWCVPLLLIAGGIRYVIEKGDGYEAAILDEAAIIAELAGISKELTPVDAPAGT